MKQAGIRILIIIVILGFSSCGTLVARDLPMKGQGVEAMVQTLVKDRSQVTVGNLKYTPKDRNDQFVIAEVRFTNVGSSSYLLDPSLFLIYGPKETTPSSPSLVLKPEWLGFVRQYRKDRLDPAESTVRSLVFAFPKDVTPAKLSHPDFGEVVIPLQEKTPGQPAVGE